MAKVVVNLSAGLEDAEKVMIAFLVEGAAREQAICFNTQKLNAGDLVGNARVAGATPLWEWIGDEPATVFSY